MKDNYEIKKIYTTMKNNFKIKHEGNERFCHDEEGSTNGWEKENEIQRNLITTDESSHDNTKNLKKEYSLKDSGQCLSLQFSNYFNAVVFENFFSVRRIG